MAMALYAQNDTNTTVEKLYHDNCASCHKAKGLSLEKLFFRYLLKYSSEVSVKSALFDFLKNPNELTSVLTTEDRKRYKIKRKTTLTDDELRRVIDLYWEKYKVFGRLK